MIKYSLLSSRKQLLFIRTVRHRTVALLDPDKCSWLHWATKLAVFLL